MPTPLLQTYGPVPDEKESVQVPAVSHEGTGSFAAWTQNNGNVQMMECNAEVLSSNTNSIVRVLRDHRVDVITPPPRIRKDSREQHF